MSITNLIPGRRDRGKHDPDTVIGRLREESVKHLNREAAADDFFAILIQDVNETNAAWRQEREHRQQAETSLTEAWDYIRELEAELAPHRAAQATRDAVTVPLMERDTSAIEDQATAPVGIDVKPLWDALGILPATDPGHVRQTTWGRDVEATQPLPKVKPAA